MLPRRKVRGRGGVPGIGAWDRRRPGHVFVPFFRLHGLTWVAGVDGTPQPRGRNRGGHRDFGPGHTPGLRSTGQPRPPEPLTPLGRSDRPCQGRPGPYPGSASRRRWQMGRVRRPRVRRVLAVEPEAKRRSSPGGPGGCIRNDGAKEKTWSRASGGRGRLSLARDDGHREGRTPRQDPGNGPRHPPRARGWTPPRSNRPGPS